MTTATTASATKQVAINDIGSAEDFLAAVELTLKFFNDGDLIEGTVVKIDRGQEVFSRSDVVDGDLLGGRGGRCGCHVVIAPIRPVSLKQHRFGPLTMVRLVMFADGRRIEVAKATF